MAKSKQRGEVKETLTYLDAHFSDFQRTLSDLTSIPSVSAEGYPGEEMELSLIHI